MQHVRLRITTRWWLRAYLYGVTLMAYALQTQPDWAKVERMLQHGIRVRLAPVTFGIEA